MRRHVLGGIGILVVVLLVGCGRGTDVPGSPTQTTALSLSSPAFVHEGTIPARYTCDGDDISPALIWDEPPAGTQRLALIVDDPDAPVGTWVHWVLYNIPSDTRELPEAFPSDAELPDGSVNGKNGWGDTGYGGPCPPSGTHRYYFKLYALDTMLDLEPGATKAQLLKAMEGHVLGEDALMGTYQKQQ
ncbi:MAG: YbhB/YbcL family Raf kinase inhibitor-like protein [Anaerolineae bacterium]|nr:YbhB/YbcL family Raf kinase inhibitor-like protein [Anaerolineae bacterium]